MAEVHCLLTAGIRLTVNAKEPGQPHGHVTLAFGQTDVPDDFWNAWVKENEEFGPYKNGLIFVHEEEDEAPKPKAAPYRKGK